MSRGAAGGELQATAARGDDDPGSGGPGDRGGGVRAAAVDDQNRRLGFRAGGKGGPEDRRSVQGRDHDGHRLFQDFLTFCS